MPIDELTAAIDALGGAATGATISPLYRAQCEAPYVVELGVTDAANLAATLHAGTVPVPVLLDPMQDVDVFAF
jgi:hypothetical protein